MVEGLQNVNKGRDYFTKQGGGIGFIHKEFKKYNIEKI